MKPLHAIQLSTLSIALAFSSAAVAATDANNFTDNNWQSSLAQEFSGLDTSGNGLLLPHEASKGKAFNKKSFAAADADKDGSIDQTEYIQHKTNMGQTNQPTAQPTNGISMTPASPSDTAAEAMSSAAVEQPEPIIQTADAAGNTAVADNAEPKKRTVGVVVDDSVITTKAKAAIFNTPDLKTLDISVQTRQGEVVLTGTVANEAAKMKAEEVVKNIGGVTSVTNNLEVKT